MVYGRAEAGARRVVGIAWRTAWVAIRADIVTFLAVVFATALARLAAGPARVRAARSATR